MRKIKYLIICFFLSANCWSQKQIPGDDQNKTILLYNAKIITGVGTVFEDGFFVVKGSLFEDNSGKKIETFGITSKNINEFVVGEIASFKDNSQVTVN